mgnify:CR=1 FL=1
MGDELTTSIGQMPGLIRVLPSSKGLEGECPNAQERSLPARMGKNGYNDHHNYV